MIIDLMKSEGEARRSNYGGVNEVVVLASISRIPPAETGDTLRRRLVKRLETENRALEL